MTERESNRKPEKKATGTVEWSCPSNIAIVKYWGKKPVQFPMNPSLSLTLRNALTHTRIDYSYDPRLEGLQVGFRFEGKRNPAFGDRVSRYLEGLLTLMPFLRHLRMEIDSSNTFPHSSGIASSASAMGALAMCLVSMESRMAYVYSSADFFRRASYVARLGSGSASRSIYPGLALWGASDGWPESSDEFAIPVTGYHRCFDGMKDSILIVEPGQKKVSSSAGHALMDTNPYSRTRFQQARENLRTLKGILAEGDWHGFIDLMEEEALSLHAMMMTGRPGYLLMQPGTLSILGRIREFRKETGTRVGFTLDAGANVHLIYDMGQERVVRDFIGSELLQYCVENRVIHDEMGAGPVEKSQ